MFHAVSLPLQARQRDAHKHTRIFKRFSHKEFVFHHGIQITVHLYKLIFKTMNAKNEVFGTLIYHNQQIQ